MPAGARRRHHPFGGLEPCPLDHAGGPRSADGVVELAPDRIGCHERVAADQPRGAPRRRSSRSRGDGRCRPRSPPADRRGPGRRPGRDPARVEDRHGILGRGAIVAPPPHGARTTKPPIGRRRGSSTAGLGRAKRGAGARGPRRSRRVEGWPSPARSSRGMAGPRVARRAPAARAPRGSGRTVWTSKPSCSYSGRPASVATRMSVRQPAVGRVDHGLGEGQAEALPTPRGLDPDRADPADRSVDAGDARSRRSAPSASATNGRVSGCSRTNSRLSRRSPQSWRRKAAAIGSTSAGSHRRMRGGAASRRW